MNPRSIIIDVDARGRTGWVGSLAGESGRFVGVDAVAAASAAVSGETVDIRPGAPVIASDLTPVGAMAAIVATTRGAQWTLVDGPKALMDLFSA